MTSTSFIAGNGATVTLTIEGNDAIYVRFVAGKTNIHHSGTRIDHPQHGPALFVKHSGATTTIRIPAGDVAAVDAVFAEAAARVGARQLRRDRDALTRTLNGLVQADEAERARVIAAGTHLAVRDRTAEIAAARDALAAFDAAHPEVKAAIAAERAARDADLLASGLRA